MIIQEDCGFALIIYWNTIYWYSSFTDRDFVYIEAETVVDAGQSSDHSAGDTGEFRGIFVRDSGVIEGDGASGGEIPLPWETIYHIGYLYLCHEVL